MLHRRSRHDRAGVGAMTRLRIDALLYRAGMAISAAVVALAIPVGLAICIGLVLGLL